MREPSRFIVMVFMTTPLILVGVGWRIAPEAQSLVPFRVKFGAGFVSDPMASALFTLGLLSAAAGIALPMPNAVPAMRARVIVKAALAESAATCGLVAMLLARPGAERPQTPLLLGVMIAEIALAKLIVMEVPRLEEAAGAPAGTTSPK